MIWVLVIGLALAAFAAMALIFRLPRGAWTTALAALALGLAGYAAQGSPNLPGAPKSAASLVPGEGANLVELRRAILPGDQQRQNAMVTADGFTHHEEYAEAATMLLGAVRDNPNDGEAWHALGWIFEKNGAYEDASQAYGKAIADDFLRPQALLKRATMLRLQKRYAEALPDMEESIRLDPDSVVAPNLLMIGKIQAGKTEEVRSEVLNFDFSNRPYDADLSDADLKSMGGLRGMLDRVVSASGKSNPSPADFVKFSRRGTVGEMPIDKLTIIDKDLAANGSNFAVKAAVTAEQLKQMLGVDITQLAQRALPTVAIPPVTPARPPKT